MPFTLAHPAAAVPFARSKLVLSALVIGSMAPDIQYFVRLTGQDRDAHKYPGILLITFPAAILMLVVFHALLKWPLISLMPRRLQLLTVEPARRFRWWPLSRVALNLVSLAAGIVTHIAWDAFTHTDGWIVNIWPTLRVPLFYVGRTGIPPFKIAQHMSAVLGGLLLLGWSWKWYRRATPSADRLPPTMPRAASLAVLGTCAIIAVSAGIMNALHIAERSEGLPYLQQFVSGLAVTSISIATLELLAFSAAWWIFALRSDQAWRTRKQFRRVSSQ